MHDRVGVAPPSDTPDIRGGHRRSVGSWPSHGKGRPDRWRRVPGTIPPVDGSGEVEVDLSVVIVSYRTRELLRACLASLAASVGDAPDVEIVVVDNASGDGSAEMVTDRFPRVRLLVTDENLGFARACNRGVAESRGGYVLLLNPDTVVLEDAPRRLLAFVRADPGVGIAGGRTLRPDGGVDPGSCWGLPTLWSTACWATGLSTAFPRSPRFDPESLGRWDRDSVREVDMVTGSLLMTPRSVWDELGGFDERFWMYGEDADLSWRARRRGYRPSITPEATIVHVSGASTPSPVDVRVRLFRAKVTLMGLHWSPRAARVGPLLLAAGVGARAAVARVAGRESPWTGTWSARRDWLRGWPAVGAHERGPARPNG
jgi:N-acetylglucosaminyl-diphospho-decaprenol L-rhamnosyltransferase